uniref:Putative ovule protein n=1 Tax=Solanum chacoense TaxID=4108 RepID=A0A0V0HNJ1_SOLCH
MIGEYTFYCICFCCITKGCRCSVSIYISHLTRMKTRLPMTREEKRSFRKKRLQIKIISQS